MVLFDTEFTRHNLIIYSSFNFWLTIKILKILAINFGEYSIYNSTPSIILLY